MLLEDPNRSQEIISPRKAEHLIEKLIYRKEPNSSWEIKADRRAIFT
jgi:hypothetical protein